MQTSLQKHVDEDKVGISECEEEILAVCYNVCGQKDKSVSFKMVEGRSTKGPSTFLALPSEVRLAIYRQYFSGQPRSITYPYNHPISLVDKQHWDLLLVSKFVHREALPEYYRTCWFALYTLNAPHLQRLISDATDTNFAQYAANLLVWKVPAANIFETLHGVKWVRMLGITCGVEPDTITGQIFTYETLIRALRKSRVPGFSWAQSQALFSRYPHIDFEVDLRCDFWKTKLDASGHPQREWIKTNFLYHVKTDTFVEDTRGTSKQDGLILRPQHISPHGSK